MTRIGLTQRMHLVEEYDEYRDCLDQEWAVLLDRLGFDPIPLPNRIDSVESYLDTLDLSGFIFTSGNDLAHLKGAANPAPERDTFETAVLGYAATEGLPVLGVCRGLEFLTVYFGGTLTTVEDHVDRNHPLEFTTSADAIDLEISLPEMLTVNSYHDYGIDPDDVPDELRILATASDGTVECVVHKRYPFWGIMWHPERDSPSADLDQQLLQTLLGGGDT